MRTRHTFPLLWLPRSEYKLAQISPQVLKRYIKHLKKRRLCQNPILHRDIRQSNLVYFLPYLVNSRYFHPQHAEDRLIKLHWSYKWMLCQFAFCCHWKWTATSTSLNQPLLNSCYSKNQEQKQQMVTHLFASTA